MARKVLDATVTSSDFFDTFDKVVASNPQINKTITEVRNETNLFLCEVLQYYPQHDFCLVKVLDTNEKVIAYLTHEILSYNVSILCMGDGRVGADNTYGTYIKPYDKTYGIMAKVRWNGSVDKCCLLSCVNFTENDTLNESIGTGEIKLKVGSSSISISKDRVNIMTPNLIINGLPSTAPELENYFNKDEMSVIKSDTDAQLEEVLDTITARIDNIVEKNSLIEEDKTDDENGDTVNG